MTNQSKVDRELSAIGAVASVMGYQTTFGTRTEVEGRNAGKKIREITISTVLEES